MKEQAIQKIQKAGKIGSIITLICKILVGVGIGILLLVSVACFMIPKNSIAFVYGLKGSIELYNSIFGSEIDKNGVISWLEEGADGVLINEGAISKENITIENDKIIIHPGFSQLTVDIHDLAWIPSVLALMLILAMITLVCVGRLCKAFRNCQSPFEENVIHKMHYFAYSLIPWILASSGIETVTDRILLGQKTALFSVDLGMVLIILMIFLLIFIFKYGAVLQQESDETL